MEGNRCPISGLHRGYHDNSFHVFLLLASMIFLGTCSGARVHQLKPQHEH